MRRRFTKRLVWMAIAGGLGLLLLLWWGWPEYCVSRAEAALVAQNWPAVDSWTGRARWWGGQKPAVVLWSARVARKRGLYDEMERALNEARLLGVPARRLDLERWLAEAESGNIANLRRELAELLLKGEDLPAICEAFARGCLASYRIDEAKSVLSTWEADFPKDPQPNFLRGRLLEHQSSLEEATRQFEEALKKSPGHAPSAYNLARLRYQQQRLDEALSLYQLAAPLLPDPQPALVGAAQCLRGLGRLEEARTVIEQALNRPPERLVEAYRVVGERSETALAQAPAERGWIELESDHPEAAATWLSSALKASPRDWRIRNAYASALRQLGRIDEAAKETEKVEATRAALAVFDRMIERIQRTPGDVEARYEVGRILLEHVSPNQGLVWLSSVLSYNADHVPTLELLARYYEDHRAENPEYEELARRHRRRLEELSARP